MINEKNLVSHLKRYINDVLKMKIEMKLWKNQEFLPIFITNGYTFYVTLLNEFRCLLMISRESEEITPGNIKKHCILINEQWDGPIIYVQSSISSFNRKRLIEHNIPFIVPDNQMYLPPLGIDLREYFKKSQNEKISVFSPATQAVIIYAILQEKHENLTPTKLSEKLGYTQMTMTRVFNELQVAEVGEFFQKGRERYWIFPAKQTLWEETKNFLQSPIRRRVWLKTPSFKIVSGLSALSHFSFLSPPLLPVFAIGLNQWSEYKKLPIEELPSDDGALLELEIWNYDPALFASEGFVDRFSLYLSLKNEKDERVELAVEEMMEEIKW